TASAQPAACSQARRVGWTATVRSNRTLSETAGGAGCDAIVAAPRACRYHAWEGQAGARSLSGPSLYAQLIQKAIIQFAIIWGRGNAPAHAPAACYSPVPPRKPPL